MKIFKKLLVPTIPLTTIVFVVSCGDSTASDDKNKWEKAMHVWEDSKGNTFYDVTIRIDYTYRGSEIRSVVSKETYLKRIWENNGRRPNANMLNTSVAIQAGIFDTQHISIINIEPVTY